MTAPPDALPIVFNPDYEMDIGDHVFPTAKYKMTMGLLRAEGWAREGAIHAGGPATEEQLLLVHTPGYLEDFEKLRWTPRTMFSELPLSEGIVRGFKLMAGGSILAARLALRHGVAMHIGGGFHHAFSDHAEGFCYINDVAVAIRALQGEGLIRKAAVIDVDLHQGNGTAHIFERDASVFTFSIHQEYLYPEKQRSNVDIGLHHETGDEEYLAELARVVPDRIAEHGPDLVALVAGADPYKEDQLGDLRLTIEGLQRRDRLIARACRERGWPLFAALAGGYARDSRDTARIHANTAIELAKAWGIQPAAS